MPRKIITEWEAVGELWCLTKDDGREPCYRVHIIGRDSLGDRMWKQAMCLLPKRTDGGVDYENLASRALAELVEKVEGNE